MHAKTTDILLGLVGAALLLVLLPAAAIAQDAAAPMRADDALARDVPSVSSSRVLIWYQTAPGSPPATAVELWFTPDGGQTWKQWSHVETTQNPIAFDADRDGLYGFFIILHNDGGASAPPPAPGTAAHQWVRVDRSAPIVQVLELRPDKRFAENREIHIRWSTRDDNLRDRPVAIHYRTEQTRTFRLVADAREANGTYRWTVPEGATGRIEIKISATDRAANTGRYVADWLRIEGGSQSGAAFVQNTRDRRGGGINHPRNETSGGRPGDDTDGAAQSTRPRSGPNPRSVGTPWQLAGHGEPDAGDAAVSTLAMREAKKRYDQGTYHRLRGERAVATERYREALELNPELLEARNDLAGLLLLEGKHEQAEREYRRILATDPEHRAALKGLALSQATRRNYRSAQESLRRLLQLEPDNAEAWLHFGDVTFFMGDRRGAREAWLKARSLEQAPEKIKQRAGKRLAIYRGDLMPGE